MEVSKLEMNQPLGSSYLTAHAEKLSYPLVSKWPGLILHFCCVISIIIVIAPTVSNNQIYLQVFVPLIYDEEY